jgi:eukaryotic-like serine/threonine-protein kinase
MVMRAMGIGPAGSLMAAGVLGEREQLLLADFDSPSGDSTLGPIVTDALRADLAQSRNIELTQPVTIRESLRRMRRPTNTVLDATVAREIATREGVKAIIEGDILPLGSSFILSARLVETQTGRQLATFRESAGSAEELIPAIGKLSRGIRAKVGESLRAVQATPSLERVSTSSLDALRKYVQGSRAIIAGESQRGMRMLEEAVAIDTTFAMAYRRLASEANNRLMPRDTVAALVSRAYRFRERLADSERYLTEGAYWTYGPEPSNERAVAAYDALLEVDPGNTTAMNNLANRLRDLRQFRKSDSLAQLAFRLSPSSGIFALNAAAGAIIAQDSTRLSAILDDLAQRQPASPFRARIAWTAAWSEDDRARAAYLMDSVRRAASVDPAFRSMATAGLQDLQRAGGQLRSGWSLSEDLIRFADDPTRDIVVLQQSLLRARDVAWFLNDRARAQRMIDEAMTRLPVDALPEDRRPYMWLAIAQARAGLSSQALATLNRLERREASAPSLYGDIEVNFARGEIALARGRHDEALVAFRAADRGACTSCALPMIAMTFDAKGQQDSAIAYFRRYVDDRNPWREDGDFFAGSHKRLGELYEARGERQKALGHYLKFVELWKNADPELQPRVAEVRQRIARLRDTEGRR